MLSPESHSAPDLLKNDWTIPERWVWDKICRGEPADFNLHEQHELDPKIATGWTTERILRPAFLETILLHESCQKALHRRGIRILGAWIKEKLDLSYSNLTADWWLEKSRLEQDVTLDFVRTSRTLSFEGSVFIQNLSFKFSKLERELSLQGTQVLGKLDMNTLYSGGSIFMIGGQFAAVEMVGAMIAGGLELQRTVFTNKLEMSSLKIEANLLMSEAVCTEVMMGGTQIGSTLDLSKVKITDKLEIASATIGNNLLIQEVAELEKLLIRSTKINGQFALINTKIKEILEIDFITVSESMIVEELEFNKEARITYADIKGPFFLSKSKLTSLDLGSTTIGGEFKLGERDSDITWGENAFLNLRNAQVGALEDGGRNSWPATIDFDGFTCAKLGGSWNPDQKNKNMADREAAWFVDWLARDVSYSPQPYQYFAAQLMAMGHTEKSNAILYAAKNREKKEAYQNGQISKFIGLSLLNWTIGYGIGGKYFRSLLWVLALTLLGLGVLNTMEATQIKGFWYNFFFSFDILLPIIDLNDSYKLDFTGWQLYYFYFHILMGFLLGSFVLAGLSGITKK